MTSIAKEGSVELAEMLDDWGIDLDKRRDQKRDKPQYQLRLQCVHAN
jgi:hypothetical protein